MGNLLVKSALVGVLLLAAALRMYGLDWDQGHMFHPDERSMFMRGQDMYWVLTNDSRAQGWLNQWPEMERGVPGIGSFLSAERSALNPHWFPLGNSMVYLLVGVVGVIEIIPFDLELRHVARGLTGLADVGSVALLYVIGRRLWNSRTGLLAATLGALCVAHIQFAHFYRPEAFVTLTLLASFWAMLRFLDYGRFRDALLVGILVGASMIPKVTLLIVYAPLGLTLLWVCRDRVRSWNEFTPGAVLRFAPYALVILGAALAVVAVTHPYMFLDWGSFLEIMQREARIAREAGWVPYTHQYVDTPDVTYHMKQLLVWGMGPLLGLTALIAIGVTGAQAFRRGERIGLLLVMWVVPTAIFLTFYDAKFLRYMYPVTPFLILMASNQLVNGVVWPRVWRAALPVVVGGTALYAIAFMSIYTRPHPAVEAGDWLASKGHCVRVISGSHWDEGIPNLGSTQTWTFPAYEPDSRSGKLDELVSRLESSDYFYFYSNRVYGSLSRQPDEFPDTSAFLRLLFAERLGYQIVGDFTSYPSLLGVQIRDDPFKRASLREPGRPEGISFNWGYADENVVNYDHPRVIVFQNTERWPAETLKQLVEDEAERPLRVLSSPYDPPLVSPFQREGHPTQWLYW